jgi:hypothetical protein
MAQEIINVGAAPNDGQGDPIREAFTKCNDNFTELFSGLGGSNAISNGNSVVQIPTANGNISMSVSGTANVAVITTTGITVSNTVAAANLTSAGAVSAVGNVTGAFFIGDGSQLINLPAGNYSNANVDAYLPTYSGNITANAISAAGNIESSGNISTTRVVNANVVLASSVGVPAVGVTTFILANARATTINFGGAASNIFIANVNSTTQIAGNLTAGGTVSVTGNVTANNFVGASAGTTTLSATANLDLSANTAVRVTGGATFRLPSLDASQIANIVAANGDMIYNTTVNKIQGYEDGAWGNLI